MPNVHLHWQFGWLVNCMMGQFLIRGVTKEMSHLSLWLTKVVFSTSLQNKTCLFLINFSYSFEIAEQVSDGLEEAVLTMWEGEVSLFTIPPQCLQDQHVVVPPGSSVTYEIELLSCKCVYAAWISCHDVNNLKLYVGNSTWHTGSELNLGQASLAHESSRERWGCSWEGKGGWQTIRLKQIFESL